MKRLIDSIQTMICLVTFLSCSTSPVMAMTESGVPTSESGESEYSDEQLEILNNFPAMEAQYLEYGLNAPVETDLKNPIATRASAGAWTWRDGVICVTTEGLGTNTVNTWHSAIVAPQALEVVAEAPKPGSNVRLRPGAWSSSSHTIWQVGVNSTSVDQDWNAGYWAGQQVGKPYNLNFWNARQTDSFYCSQLVWAAYYYSCNTDLNKSDNDIGGAIAIHPGEFVENSNTTIIYRNR